ncbi:hypothetical protein GW17_00034265 [Ensete ventricosum]|nr:hypothetical protein GW17_00034265 [Ensete ventricosum]
MVEGEEEETAMAVEKMVLTAVLCTGQTRARDDRMKPRNACSIVHHLLGAQKRISRTHRSLLSILTQLGSLSVQNTRILNPSLPIRTDVINERAEEFVTTLKLRDD